MVSHSNRLFSAVCWTLYSNCSHSSASTSRPTTLLVQILKWDFPSLQGKYTLYWVCGNQFSIHLMFEWGAIALYFFGGVLNLSATEWKTISAKYINIFNLIFKEFKQQLHGLNHTGIEYGKTLKPHWVLSISFE